MAQVIELDEAKSRLIEKLEREQRGSPVRITAVCQHPRYREFRYPTHAAKVCLSCGHQWASFNDVSPPGARLGVSQAEVYVERP